MKKEYTTWEIYNLVEECNFSPDWMKRKWIPVSHIIEQEKKDADRL